MAKMRAVQVSKPNGPLELVQRDIPEPGPGWVRIKVQACGVCHSDSLIKEGLWPGLQYPRVPGHEIAGHVDALFLAGMYYNDGSLGVKRDGNKAFAYMTQAAERGHVYAAWVAATMANDGNGVKTDHLLAYRIARNLADQGEVVGAVVAASALLQMKDAKDHEDEVLYWMDVAIRDGDDKIRSQVSELRPRVVAAFNRANAPPQYQPRAWKAWTSAQPDRTDLVRAARRIKARVCEKDPYEQSGLRRVLNFGHTVGHALETISGFRLRHGEAVGIGMLCALDVGQAMGVTSRRIAQDVETALTDHPGPVRKARSHFAKLMKGTSADALQKVLQSDKKATRADALTMILLERIGRASAVQVPHEVWRKLLVPWREGVRP